MSKLDIISLSFSLLSLNYLINNEVDEDYARWALKMCVLIAFVILVFAYN